MITIVSFYIARLLKEKGFDNFCKYLWHFNGSDCIKMINKNSENFGFSAPTIAEVVMWILEKHKIWIQVSNCNHNGVSGWCFDINNTPTGVLYLWKRGDTIFNSPAEAYEAAIEYCLANLIKEEKK